MSKDPMRISIFSCHVEVRNETSRPIYVALCRSFLGQYYLHIANRKSKHVDTLVKAKDYSTVYAKPEDL